MFLFQRGVIRNYLTVSTSIDLNQYCELDMEAESLVILLVLQKEEQERTKVQKKLSKTEATPSGCY